MPRGEKSKDQKGATLLEYAITVSAVSLLVVLGAIAVSSGVRRTFCSIANVTQLGGSTGRLYWDPSLNNGRGMCVEAGSMGDNPRF